MGFIVPPSQWERQHAAPIFTAQQFQAANGGRLPDTPMWRMLEFRHALNAARFNFYHPNIGRMIAAQGVQPGGPPLPQVIVPGWKGSMRGPTPPPAPPVFPPPPIIPPPPIVPPPIVPPPPVTPPLPPTNPVTPPPDGGGGTTTPPNPQEPGAPPVPEPSAVVLFALAILVAGVGFIRFRRRSIPIGEALAVQDRRG